MKALDTGDAGFHLGLKVGVMGGAGYGIDDAYLQAAFGLGKAIAMHKCVTVTGACGGLPLAAARGAQSGGGLVVGISPALSLDEHAYRYESPTLGHDLLVFTGSGLMGREVVNIRSSDIVTIVGGSSGTLGELAIAYDEGKLIGVLTGTGGISDMVEAIISACKKETGARIIYQSDPELLLRELLHAYRSEHHRRPSCFCRERASTVVDETTTGAERDVVCGMWIESDSAAARRTTESGRLVFCSLMCAESFDASPERYSSDHEIKTRPA